MFCYDRLIIKVSLNPAILLSSYNSKWLLYFNKYKFLVLVFDTTFYHLSCTLFVKIFVKIREKDEDI